MAVECDFDFHKWKLKNLINAYLGPFYRTFYITLA